MAQGTQPMRNYWLAVLPVSCVFFVILIAPRIFLNVPYREQGNYSKSNCTYVASQHCSTDSVHNKKNIFLLKKCAIAIALSKFSYQNRIVCQRNHFPVVGYEGLCY